MNTTYTQGDVLDFILENRGDKVYHGWSVEQILEELRRAIGDNTFAFCSDTNNGKLLGVCTARKLETPSGEKVMYITGILTLRRGILKLFFDMFRNMYPEYKLMQSNRKKKVNRLTTYSKLNRFGRLLERLS